MCVNMKLIEDAAKALGVSFEPIHDRVLSPGETYLAHRNGPVKLLTCREDDRINRWVLPMEMDYAFDTHECFRVIQ